MRRIENYYDIRKESKITIETDDTLKLSQVACRDSVFIKDVNYSYNNSLYSFLANELTLLYNNTQDINAELIRSGENTEAGGNND